ncbi:MAG: ATP-binding protein, partial [Streptosporangiaceae bacterium]
MIAAQTFHQSFPGDPASVSAARRYAAAAMGGSPAADLAVLAVSELAGNAVRWTRSGQPGGCYALRLVVSPLSHAAVFVADQGPVAGRSAGLGSEGGRGLKIVAAIAQAWGVMRAGCSASAGPVHGEPTEAARVMGTAASQCVWFRTGWQQPLAAEPVAVSQQVTYQQVLARAGARCECAGACGHPHGGRCRREHAPARSLHLVPVWPAGP